MPDLTSRWEDSQIPVIVYEKINLSDTLVVVVVHLEAVRIQFLCDYCLIYRSQVDAFLILEYRIYIVAIKEIRQQTYIVQVQLQQVFLL